MHSELAFAFTAVKANPSPCNVMTWYSCLFFSFSLYFNFEYNDLSSSRRTYSSISALQSRDIIVFHLSITGHSSLIRYTRYIFIDISFDRWTFDLTITSPRYHQSLKDAGLSSLKTSFSQSKLWSNTILIVKFNFSKYPASVLWV